MPNLTKRTVDALRPRAGGKDLVVFDNALPGFGMRVKPSGAKSWLIQYRNAQGLSRRVTLARFGVLTPEQARREAKLRLAEVAKGLDPAADKRAARGAMTVSELCDQYLENAVGRIKASTLAVDKSRIERHVKPLLGKRPVVSLTATDMEKFQRDVIAGKHLKAEAPAGDEKIKRKRGGVARGGPAVAARTLGMLGTILQGAVRDKIVADNPARGIDRPEDKSANPPFSFERVHALGAAMREAETEDESKVGLQAIRLLLLTGCRRMEGLSLTCGAVDRHAHCFRFDDTKSGKQIRAIGRSALDLLADIAPKGPKAGDPVFPSKSKAGHLIGLPKIWARVAKRAGIEDVSLHGLRHWFASAATELGYSDLIIGALLGHSKRGITGRYASAPDPALIAAADKVSMALAAALDDTRPMENGAILGAA